MSILIAGLALFFALHLVPMLPQLRARLASGLRADLSALLPL